MDERRLLETSELSLERQLISAAGSGKIPASVRRRALGALGLLVLVVPPTLASTPAAAPRARASVHPRSRQGVSVVLAGAVTVGAAVYLAVLGTSPSEPVRTTRVAQDATSAPSPNAAAPRRDRATSDAQHTPRTAQPRTLPRGAP